MLGKKTGVLFTISLVNFELKQGNNIDPCSSLRLSLSLSLSLARSLSRSLSLSLALSLSRARSLSLSLAEPFK